MRKLFTYILIGGMLLGLTACGKAAPKDAAELINTWQEKEHKDITLDIKADFYSNFIINDKESSINVTLKSNTKSKNQTETIKLDNTIEYSIMTTGEDLASILMPKDTTGNIKAIIDINKDKNTATSYIKQENEDYIKSSVDIDKEAIKLLTDFKLNPENFTLEKETKTVNNVKCYVVSGKLTTKDFTDIKDIPDIEFPVTLYFKADDNRDLFAIDINLKETLSPAVNSLLKNSTITGIEKFELNVEEARIQLYNISTAEIPTIYIPTATISDEETSVSP